MCTPDWNPYLPSGPVKIHSPMALKRIMSFPCLKPSKALIPHATALRDTPHLAPPFTWPCFPLGPQVSLPPCNPLASLLSLLVNTPNWIQLRFLLLLLLLSGTLLLFRPSLNFYLLWTGLLRPPYIKQLPPRQSLRPQACNPVSPGTDQHLPSHDGFICVRVDCPTRI